MPMRTLSQCCQTNGFWMDAFGNRTTFKGPSVFISKYEVQRPYLIHLCGRKVTENEFVGPISQTEIRHSDNYACTTSTQLNKQQIFSYPNGTIIFDDPKKIFMINIRTATKTRTKYTNPLVQERILGCMIY